MSEGDREQLQRIIDVIYETLKKDICEGRNIREEEFDRIVNEELIIIANDAKKLNLVDTLLRWDKMDIFVKDIEMAKKIAKIDRRQEKFLKK